MSSLQKLASHHLLRRIPPPIPPLRRYSLPPNPLISGEQDPLIFDQRNLPTDYNPSTFDPTEHRTPPSDRVWRLVDEISSLTLAEIVNLSSILMRKADLTDFPVIGIMKMGDSLPGVSDSGLGAESEVKEEEKTEQTVFELKLESFEAAMKIRVIKEVRAMTDLGLKEAKELVEKSPCVIKSGVSKEEAERVLEKMKDAGAKVVMV